MRPDALGVTRMPALRTCAYCGYQFMPARPWQKHCSVDHRRKSWVVDHPRIDLTDVTMPLELRQIIMDWVQLGQYKGKEPELDLEST